MRWHKDDAARQTFTLVWNDGTSALVGATSVHIYAELDSTITDPLTKFDGACTIVDASAGTCSYLFTALQTAVAGMYRYWFVVTYSDATTKSVPSGDVQWLFIYA
jgi:hypothetical protein